MAMFFRPIVMNAVEYVVFPGAVNKDTRWEMLLRISQKSNHVQRQQFLIESLFRMRVLEEIERCDCPHFLILFRLSSVPAFQSWPSEQYQSTCHIYPVITMTNDHSCRDSKLQFRGLYAYYPDTDEVFKIYGTGPRQVCIKVLYCPDLIYKRCCLRWRMPWLNDITNIIREEKNSLRCNL